MGINKENVDKWIGKFRGMDPDEANEISEGLSQKERSGLLGIALESSKLVLTANYNQVDQLLIKGVMCLLIEGCIQDPRDSIGMLALLNNSATIRGLDLNEMLRDLHLDKRLHATEYIEHWLKRENKEISQFGFSAIEDNEGIVTDYHGISFNSFL